MHCSMQIDTLHASDDILSAVTFSIVARIEKVLGRNDAEHYKK